MSTRNKSFAIAKAGRRILSPVLNEDGKAWGLARSGYIRAHTAVATVRAFVVRQYKTYVSHDSIFFDKSKLWMCGFYHPKKVALAIEAFDPSSVLDVGCGQGNALSNFIDAGIDASGIEGSSIAIESSPVAGRIVQHNLNEPIDLGRKFDLVWCVEVAEHIHPDYVQNFLGILTLHGDTVLISAAPPGQHGELHFNEQPPDYWIEKFSEIGYGLNDPLTQKFRQLDEEFSENILIFEREGSTPRN